MLFVPLGVNATPMDGGAEDELPQPANPKVRRAISPDSNTATVTRFTVPPDTREFRISPDLVTEDIMLRRNWLLQVTQVLLFVDNSYYAPVVVDTRMPPWIGISSPLFT